MTHTPAPWVFDSHTGHILAGDEQDWEVVGQALNPDNGRMMAASPDLVSAAKNLVDCYTHGGEQHESCWAALESAIAKAEVVQP